MPRRPTRLEYQEQVAGWLAEGFAPGEIYRRVKKWADERGRDDYPTERTVYRIARRLEGLPKHERELNGQLRWPKSFELGLLPWEASRACLDLLLLRNEHPLGLGRPTVRQARWCWRLMLAAPDLTPSDAAPYATFLSTAELAAALGTPTDVELTIDWFLAYRPWTGQEEHERFAAAIYAGRAVPPSIGIEEAT